MGTSYRVQLPSEFDSLNSLVAGTSASCPVAAGFFSNVNAARLAAGKGSIGWANPALYKYASSFIRDVTSGNNIVGANCSVGFYATPGWDPTTGLGSIDYGKFESLMLSLGTVNAHSWAPTAIPTLSPRSIPIPKPTLPPMKIPIRNPSRSPTRTPTSVPAAAATWSPSPSTMLTPSLSPSEGLPPSVVASGSPTATTTPVADDYPSSTPSTIPPDSIPSVPSNSQSDAPNYLSLQPTEAINPPATRADTLNPTAGSAAVLRGFQVMTRNILPYPILFCPVPYYAMLRCTMLICTIDAELN